VLGVARVNAGGGKHTPFRSPKHVPNTGPGGSDIADSCWKSVTTSILRARLGVGLVSVPCLYKLTRKGDKSTDDKERERK
jgi:hypothetical protein